MSETDRNKIFAECLDAFWAVGDCDRLMETTTGAGRAPLVYKRQVAEIKVAEVMRLAGMEDAVVLLPSCHLVLWMAEGRIKTQAFTAAVQVVARSLKASEPPPEQPAVIEPRPAVAEAVTG